MGTMERPLPGVARELPRRLHLLGIGGGGMSGLARLVRARGGAPSGRDREAADVLGELRAEGIDAQVEVPGEALPPDVEAVVRSAAVPLDHPHVVAARERGLPVWKYSEALGRLAPAGRTLAVAGTHGKTTTSWLLWHALAGVADELGGPEAGGLVGGECRALHTNARWPGDAGWFCVEACEYDRSFLQLAPRGAIVTNVEADHLDYYRTLEALEEAFARFVDRTDADGPCVLGPEVPERVESACRGTAWRLGRELALDLLGETHGCFTFRLRGPGWASPPVRPKLPGRFNAENAALALALAVGASADRVDAAPGEVAAAGARGLERFPGARRRFEPWGTVGGVAVVHDYAHHPTEVRATLEAARRRFPGSPLCVLFQPHQHSRTARFLEEFAQALRFADRVGVADVYGARAHIDGERLAGAPELVDRLGALGVEARSVGGLDRCAAEFAALTCEGAAVLVLGAGDVETVRDDLLDQLALRRPAERGARV